MTPRNAFTPAKLSAWFDLLCGESREAVWLPVLSGSMGPLLLPGDEVQVTPCGWQSCRTGEIIVFRQGGALTAHRLVLKVEVCGKYVLLFQQGDATGHGGFIRQENILGRCSARRRDGIETALNDYGTKRRLARTSRRTLIPRIMKGGVKWIQRSLSIFRLRRGR